VKKFFKSKQTVIVATFCALTACTPGPTYERTINTLDTQGYINSEALLDANKEFSISRWWERIDDPLLQEYIDQLLTDNLSLQASAERVIQARQNLAITNGERLPTLATNTSAGRSFSPVNGNRNYTSDFEAGLSTSWQIDLFGKIRKAAEANIAELEATRFDEKALQHSLIAELVTRRIAVATNKKRLEIAHENAENRKVTLDVVNRRYTLGMRDTNLGDVKLAEENYSTIRADLPRYERALRDEAYTLDVLLGQTPGTTDPLKGEFPMIAQPLAINACMPADLLDRRPDLLASELRLKAANANIGVAIADLYPALNLSGSLGFSDDGTSNLFTADQLAGSILASLTTRLFEGGRLRANIALRESQAREQAALYAENILNAMREAESGLLAETKLTAQENALKESVTALQKAEDIAQERYILGIIDLPQFLDTQQRRYNAEQNLITIQQERWNARIALYLALGGDWFNADNNSCAINDAT